MSSVANHWKRFLVLRTTLNQSANPGSGALVRRSAVEWQRLADTVHTLLRYCPVSRLALLDHLTPIFGDYFILWWQRRQQITESSVDGLEDLQAVELVLKGVVQLLRELVISHNASDEFVSGACSWVLYRLRPACVTPPTQMLGSLKRLLNFNTRLKCVRSGLGDQGSQRTPVSSADIASTIGIESADLSRVRCISPMSDSSDTNRVPSDSDSSSESGEFADSRVQPESSSPKPGAPIHVVEDVLLDLDPNSPANLQLLGVWSSCTLLVDLLQLAYELLMGTHVRLPNVLALLSIATIPLPPELSNLVDLSATNYRPSPRSVLPHWVLIWLLYQVSRQSIAGISAVHRLADLVLEAATEFPFSSAVVPDSTASPDTVACWMLEQRLDAHFWATSCLTHLLFLGDGVPGFVSSWLIRKLSESVSDSPTDSISIKRLLLVWLHLGLLSVPTPPTVESPSSCLSSVRRSLKSPSDCPTRLTPNSTGHGVASVTPVQGPFITGIPGVTTLDPGKRYPDPHVRPMCIPPFSKPQSVGLLGSPSTTGQAASMPPYPPPCSVSTVFTPQWMSSHQSSAGPSVHGDIRGLFDAERTPGLASTGRQPASLVWLLSLARRIRAATLSALAHALEGFTDSRLDTFLSHWTDFLTNDSDHILYMTSKLLLSFADDCGGARLLAFFLKSAAAAEFTNIPPDSRVKHFGVLCSRLLQMTSTTALLMVHTSSEAADNLNRGGCEGLLRAVRSLARSVPSGGPLATKFGSQLFEFIIKPTSAAIAVSRLMVAVSLTLDPILVTEALVALCMSHHEHSAKTMMPMDDFSSPLSLFFLIVGDLEAAWIARCAHGSFSHVEPNFSVESKHSFIHDLYVNQFLPTLWTRIATAMDAESSSVILLSSLVWLVRVELWRTSRCTVMVPKLTLALSSQLVPMLKLMCSTINLDIVDLLLTVFELAAEMFIETSPQSPHLRPRGQRVANSKPQLPLHIPFPLTTSQCLVLGRLFIHLIGLLLKQMYDCDFRIPSKNNIVRLVGLLCRVKTVLISLAAGHPLLRITALRCLPDEKVISLWSGAGTRNLVKSPYSLAKARTLDFSSVFSISHLPDNLAFGPPITSQFYRHEHLLLDNPPAELGQSGSDTFEESLVRGRLRKPLDARGSLRNRTPGTTSNGFASHSSESHGILLTYDSAEPIDCNPTQFFWFSLIESLSHGKTDSSINFSQWASHESLDHILGTRLQQLLLPHGMHLPQTSVVHLPSPVALVLPPIGVGLERVLALTQLFCPDVRAQPIGSYVLRSPKSDQQITSCLLEISLIYVLDSEAGQLMNHLKDEASERTWFVNGVLPADPFKTTTQDALPLLSYSKLIIGLLMGLESSWAGPVAPRMPISDTISCLTANNGRFAQGLFPVPCSEELLTAQARRIAVDYGQRRVDCRSSIFRLTKRLLMALAKFAICHDYLIGVKRSEASGVKSERVLSELPYVPLDRLLYSLTPREMAILLSDVRRNLRLRLAFDLIERAKQSSTVVELPESLKYLVPDGQPPPCPPPLITAGLLLALIQTHMVEPGIAELVGPLFRELYTLHPVCPPARHLTDGDTVMEEVDVDGEVMVVLSD